MSLREAWQAEAGDWLRFAREDDVYAWRFNLPAFLRRLPQPGRLTVDVGCGEGRVARELIARGHNVFGVDASPDLVAAAQAGDPPVDCAVADAASMPVDDGAADLAVSFMTLQSVDDPAAVLAEVARVLEPGGRLCLAVVHPANSAERAPSYFDEHRFAFRPEHGAITLHDVHRPLAAYFAALAAAGFLTEDVGEPVPGPELLSVHPQAERWTRTPCFLHVTAVRR